MSCRKLGVDVERRFVGLGSILPFALATQLGGQLEVRLGIQVERLHLGSQRVLDNRRFPFALFREVSLFLGLGRIAQSLIETPECKVGGTELREEFGSSSV